MKEEQLHYDVGPDEHVEPPEPPPVDDDSDIGPEGAISVLRRGAAVTPELKQGLVLTAVTAVFVAIGRLVIPILIQQVLDRGVLGDEGFRPGFVLGACAIGLVVVIAVGIAFRTTYLRVVRTTESVLYSLRVRTFEHIHDLSLADHTATRKGVLVSRVTSDIETLSQFAGWGGVTWIVNSTVVVGTLLVMAVYSWQLTLVAVVCYIPMLPILRALQERQLMAYDELRSRVAETLTEVSETVQGAAVVRAYGNQPRARQRVGTSIRNQYRAQMVTSKYFSFMLPLGDLFGALALTVVAMVGVSFGPGWGLEAGTLIAVLFLATLVAQPIAEIGEVLDMTQTAIAGWRKILTVLDQPIEVVEPEPGVELPTGPLAVRADSVDFAYRTGGRVLDGVSIDIPAGAAVAIVGETGSGKTTFARLICRLADPTTGQISVGGIDLREVAPESRRRAIRMVPQDGFLFDTSVWHNVRFGRDGATFVDVQDAFEALGLGWWVDTLPQGLDTGVGERGDNLSVGERQLVALARAHLADPGVLVLDEATSAVDPDTERALGEALAHLSTGRTTISVAHRLSTAEAADLVLVFDRGRLVEQGHHRELVDLGGIYSRLYDAWLGNTRTTR